MVEAGAEVRETAARLKASERCVCKFALAATAFEVGSFACELLQEGHLANLELCEQQPLQRLCLVKVRIPLARRGG